MCLGTLHKHENYKDSGATLGIDDILGQRWKQTSMWKGEAIRLQKWERVIYREWRKRGTYTAGKSLQGNSETRGHREYLAHRLGVFLTLKVIKPKLPSYSRFFCLNLLGWKGKRVKGSLWVFCFFINFLKSISQTAAPGWKTLRRQ